MLKAADAGKVRSDPIDGRHTTRRPVWAAIVVPLVLAGSLGSVFAAYRAAHDAAGRSHKEFVASSESIASTLRLAIERERDLYVGAQAFILTNPHATEQQFLTWVADIGAMRRFPELVGIGETIITPASQLPAAEAAGRFTVIPPGNRPFYCLASLGAARSARVKPRPGTDLCAGSLGKALLAARDSGASSIAPFAIGPTTTFSLGVPVYAPGMTLRTIAARRAAFVGWVGVNIVPAVILTAALVGHPKTVAQLRYGSGVSAIVFGSGAVPAGASSATVGLENGWTVRTFALLGSSSVFRNGGALLLLVGGIALSLMLGALIYILGTGRARLMTLVHERTDELRFQALHDSLTGLPNRALIVDRIDQMLARNRRNGTVGAALYVDLDDFKNVNDSLGHQAGDRLLVSVAARMANTLRGADTIGRMGGDEFVVLIDGGELAVAPGLVAERILDVMRQPFELDGASAPLVVSTSVGIALGDRATGGELLRDADVALYQAKAGGKNRFEFFRPEMQTDIGRRIALEFDLRSALAGSQFRLVYQPIYDLEDLTVVGLEALLRWEHPVEGVLQPDEFIPILEQTGQIREVGAWVLHEACAQMASWHERGSSLDVSVNVSARQLEDDSIGEHVRAALEASGLPATSLIVEVTETALMRDASSAVRRIEQIKRLGVRIAVDDFGTGYASLGYLQQFPVDYIKIDKSFTNAMATSPESKALVRTLVQLGKDLGLKTLAEGVETTEELDLLRSDQVNEVQGFLFSRPLDPETIESQLLAPMRLAAGVPSTSTKG